MVEIIVLGVNNFGEEVYGWLCDRDDADVLALLTEAEQLSLVERLEPDLLVSAGFRHIVPGDVLDVPDLGAVNLHPSYLPYNRGANPNVWSIVEDTPAGVSVHYMTPDVDAGPIIARREVEKRPDDTGRTLYRRLEREQVDLFKQVWPDIRDETAETVDQDPEAGTYHYKRDFPNLFEIDREETVVAGEFLDRLRALTFPPYRNAYFEAGGSTYYVEVDITPAEDHEEASIHWNLPTYEENGDIS